MYLYLRLYSNFYWYFRFFVKSAKKKFENDYLTKLSSLIYMRR
jgi:hypothetical protein